MVSHVFLQFNLTLVNKNSIIYYGFQKGTSCVNYEKRGCQESDLLPVKRGTTPWVQIHRSPPNYTFGEIVKSIRFIGRIRGKLHHEN